MLDCLLVADRGAGAVRVVRTAQRLGVKAVAVHTGDDTDHARDADERVLLGARGYCDVPGLLEAAAYAGARGIHPGWGPLAADPGLAQAVMDAGLVWVGAAPEVLARTRTRADDHGDVEVQVLGLAGGRVVSLGERSVRAPITAPVVDERTRAVLTTAAIVAAQQAGLVGLATVAARGVEVVGLRPWLEPAHVVTEAVTGIDLVEQQLLVALGDRPSYDVDALVLSGSAVADLDGDAVVLRG